MESRPLPTAAIADACVRLKVAERAVALHPVLAGRMVAGPAVPVRHAGSVDVFFEALQAAPPGGVLVIDNAGRLDEGCIGDLTALEAMHHKVAAIVVDGCHRDTDALRRLGLPVWSRASFPFGPRTGRPRAPDALTVASVADFRVGRDDVVACDDDGAVFIPAGEAPRVWDLAARIQRSEADQATAAAAGHALCEQFEFRRHLERRRADPSLTFRAHLRALGKSIEE
jgi:regulator of RNase E activity RraA